MNKPEATCILRNVLMTMLVAVAFGCGHKPSKEEVAAHPEEAPPPTTDVARPKSNRQASIEAKELAVEEEAAFVTEFVFEKGKSVPSAMSEKQVGEMLAKARTQGKIAKIKVITWPDENSATSNPAAIALVKSRNERIKNQIEKSEKNARIEMFNMAERPTTIEAIFGGKNAEIKKIRETIGSRTNASKAIVMASVASGEK